MGLFMLNSLTVLRVLRTLLIFSFVACEKNSQLSEEGEGVSSKKIFSLDDFALSSDAFEFSNSKKSQ